LDAGQEAINKMSEDGSKEKSEVDGGVFWKNNETRKRDPGKVKKPERWVSFPLGGGSV